MAFPGDGQPAPVCQGANYRQHMIESGMDPDAKKFNMIFTKATSCIVAADSPVVKPRHVRFLDYEIELRPHPQTRHHVSPADHGREPARLCRRHRDRQRLFRARCPDPADAVLQGQEFPDVRPGRPVLCLLERRDFPKLNALDLTLTVNGAVRQQDSTSNLVYGPAETLTELSGVHDLRAGDLLATGTPAGCALSIPSPLKQRAVALFPESFKWKMFMKVQAGRAQYLKPGDIVEARIASRDGTIDLRAT